MRNDEFKGHILSRREVLGLLGGAGATFWLGQKLGGSAPATPDAPRLGAATPTATPTGKRTCIARPELTEGPFFVDEGLVRSDIRTDPSNGKAKPGVPLQIEFNVSKFGDACVALEGALVDVWHCDALGLYSDVGQNGTQGQKFLRGSQITDANGVAKFLTIFPGWYPGRTVHVHFKIRVPVGEQTHEFTSQFFFDDALTRQIFQREPYRQNGPNPQPNARDGIFNEGGRELLLDLKPEGAGYSTKFDIALDLMRAPRPNRGAGGGGPRPPRPIFGHWGD